ncbi:MAG TPA: YihA family ribosome biogenesis GTP-binding protein [Desulfotomaculum sp.]|nr:MAG: putative GTP-binding protein EngB [Desulfotomaculum sp. 46_80]HAG11999.1 YihA family ribosome biogenesis GTP-binding protein [Desulfotomaculum sp.]HBY05245.1 YihA family ribosome biogenesis GTP-binding protein [Desulfotomaculum sp.]
MKVLQAGFQISAGKLDQCPAGTELEIALAGRSNVGKSSLLNKLVGRNNLARTSGTPGRTQTINFYLINKSFYLVDLPGYGFARAPQEARAHWGHLVESYLKGRKQLCGIIQIVDIRHNPTILDHQLFEWLRFYSIPHAIVATKSDKLSRSQAIRQEKTIRQDLAIAGETPLIIFSAKTGRGKDQLWDLIETWMIPS